MNTLFKAVNITLPKVILQEKIAGNLDEAIRLIDEYLINEKDNNIKIAPVYLERNELYFLENNNGKISVVKKNGFAKYYCENYDDVINFYSYLLYE